MKYIHGNGIVNKQIHIFQAKETRKTEYYKEKGTKFNYPNVSNIHSIKLGQK